VTFSISLLNDDYTSSPGLNKIFPIFSFKSGDRFVSCAVAGGDLVYTQVAESSDYPV
jgi:hypothetical protein